MLRHICSIPPGAQACNPPPPFISENKISFFLLPSFRLLITFLIKLTSLKCLADFKNICYLTLALCSTIKLPLVMLKIELWLKSFFGTYDWGINAEWLLFCESLHSPLNTRDHRGTVPFKAEESVANKLMQRLGRVAWQSSCFVFCFSFNKISICLNELFDYLRLLVSAWDKKIPS